MSYPAVEIKAWYDIRTNKMEIGFTFIDIMLKNISKDNLDTTDNYVKPKKDVLQDIKDYFEKHVLKEKVKKESDKMNPNDYGGVREFEIVVGMVYLDDNGQIDLFGHFTDYNVIGPSQRRIKQVFSKN